MYHGGSVTLPGSVLLKRADQIVPVRTYVSFRWVRLRVCVVFWLPLYGGDHGGASPRGGVRLRDFSSSQLAQSHSDRPAQPTYRAAFVLRKVRSDRKHGS